MWTLKKNKKTITWANIIFNYERIPNSFITSESKLTQLMFEFKLYFY